MNNIKVALSDYCCRTTLQCQCHEIAIKTLSRPKQYRLEFLAEGEQERHFTDM